MVPTTAKPNANQFFFIRALRQINQRFITRKTHNTGRIHGLYGIEDIPVIPKILIYAAQQRGHFGKKAINIGTIVLRKARPIPPNV